MLSSQALLSITVKSEEQLLCFENAFLTKQHNALFFSFCRKNEEQKHFENMTEESF